MFEPKVTASHLDSTRYELQSRRPLQVFGFTPEPIDKSLASLGWRSSSIMDLHCGSHASRKDDIGRHLINADANRNALGQAHPGEDGIDVSDPLIVGLRVCNVDCAGDAVDVTAHNLIAAHQLDLSRISDPDRRNVGFLKISVNPE
jgi:hypothetical protein